MTAAARVALVGSVAAQPVSWAAGETADEAVAMVERLLDPAFLAEAGWDAAGRLLCPPPEHPLLGRPVCRAPGCQATAFGRARVCQRCRRRLVRAGLGPDAVSELPEPPCQPPSRCAVMGCPRPWKTSRDRLCLTHLRQQREVLKVPLEEFLAHPQTRPLPSCGPCQVPACTRERAGTSGSYCDAHQQRFRAATRAVPELDEAAWRAAQPAIAQYGQVSLYGLAPLVAAQLLAGLQQRTRSSTRTNEKALRSVCEKLRLHHVTTIIPASGDVFLPGPDRNAGTLLASLTRHARRALLDPETEKAKDVWDLVAFGRPGGTLPFTSISQRWLREAAKRWAAEELPRRRGRGVGGNLRSCVHSLARLSETLRLREDGGHIPAALGRADIEALLNRLAYQQNAGTLTHPSRVMTCRHLKLILSRIRAMGLTRPGGPAAGLPDDFAVSTGDIPYLPGRAEPSRDLPPEIMRQLCDQLPALERQHGVGIRTIVELVIDTGRRPDEICTLAWDCLTRDSDGSPVLIYDNHKAGRMGRRLPVTEATATLITGQKQRTRDRYPATPPDELRLFPALQRNPGGRKPVAGPGLVGRHRAWADSLPPLLLADGTEFPKAKVTLYACRHTYAQRHADAGVPPDVLRELLDHLNFDTTRQYYRVGEKRRREAVDRLTAVQFDRHGNRIWHQAKALLDSEHARRAVGEVAVPFGGCAEPSNVAAGGTDCPVRFRCAGCDHFRTDVSYLPDLTAYLDDLLRTRERLAAATSADDWARSAAAPSEQEISKIRELISRIKGDITALPAGERARIDEAVAAVRKHRAVSLGLPRFRQQAR
ncbi:MAG TPA: tyrosine-type recombinase/integrase [Streptosporangiaceae bacterium]|nr:tyrosine-type recombinase/integrase [Streptosporangiaceae bacterium]